MKKILLVLMVVLLVGASKEFDFNLGIQPCVTEVVMLGVWNEFGYRILDGPWYNYEVQENRWINHPDINSMVIVLSEGQLRHGKIISWTHESVDTPLGAMNHFVCDLEVAPDFWQAADDGFIYGKKEDLE